LKRIELRVSDVDRAVVDAVLPASPVAAHRLANPSLALVIDYSHRSSMNSSSLRWL
jgi:hypothetical protein